MREARLLGRATSELAKSFIYIATSLNNKAQYHHLSYPDEKIRFAVDNMTSRWSNFDEEKSKNPFAYLVGITIDSFREHAMKKAENDIPEFLGYSKNGVLPEVPEGCKYAIARDDSNEDGTRYVRIYRDGVWGARVLFASMPDNRPKQCNTCQFWGEGSGTGFHYDAGNVNYCKHPQIDGMQHPSRGACGEPTTMVYSEGTDCQNILTRWNFGCVLHKFIEK
jgi:hypothetical protein